MSKFTPEQIDPEKLKHAIQKDNRGVLEEVREAGGNIDQLLVLSLGKRRGINEKIEKRTPV